MGDHVCLKVKGDHGQSNSYMTVCVCVCVCLCLLEVSKQQSSFEYFWSVLYDRFELSSSTHKLHITGSWPCALGPLSDGKKVK